MKRNIDPMVGQTVPIENSETAKKADGLITARVGDEFVIDAGGIGMGDVRMPVGNLVHPRIAPGALVVQRVGSGVKHGRCTRMHNGRFVVEWASGGESLFTPEQTKALAVSPPPTATAPAAAPQDAMSPAVAAALARFQAKFTKEATR